MKTLFLSSAIALCLASTAFASPLVDSHDTTTNNIPVAVAGAAAGAEANAGAAALSGSVSGANAINTAITGPATATNTSVNSLNGGDNRATVGNVSSSSSLGSLNSFGGSSTLVAPVTTTTTDINTNGQQQGQGQQQGLVDASTHTSASTSGVANSGNSSNDNRSAGGAATANDSSTHAATSSANSNGAGQTTSITTNYEAQKRNPVSSAYAAPLQIGSLVCGMSKVSGALQLPGVGASGQVGTIDAGCERRSTADVFARLGLTYEACIIMVRDPVAVAAGLSAATCLRPVAPVAEVVAPPAPTVPAQTYGMAPIPNPVPVQDGERHARTPRG